MRSWPTRPGPSERCWMPRPPTLAAPAVTTCERSPPRPGYPGPGPARRRGGGGRAAAARQRAGRYSLGMRQRLGLAGALLGDPEVLVLDEPGNGLDPQGIRWLRDLLRSLAAEGRAVLVSSHILAEARQTVDDVVVFSRGQTITQAPLGELLAARPGSTLEDIYLELTGITEGEP